MAGDEGEDAPGRSRFNPTDGLVDDSPDDDDDGLGGGDNDRDDDGPGGGEGLVEGDVEGDSDRDDVELVDGDGEGDDVDGRMGAVVRGGLADGGAARLVRVIPRGALAAAGGGGTSTGRSAVA
jgi:hypothetical protein